ncbi:MAG: hypothetical protein ABH883_06805 [Candidatus Omnitrophota bacterium]
MNIRSEEHVEQHILILSVSAALFFAVFGLVWGALAWSQMFIFDGIYSFISVIMASLSVYVAEIMKSSDTRNFLSAGRKWSP